MSRLRVAAAFTLVLVLGCAGTSATPLPRAVRTEGGVFFVENHGKDNRNLERIIGKALRTRGLDVTAGAAAARPENVEFVVTYEDRWAWDMRTYLRLIRIDVHDVHTGAVVATSQSHQDSLTAMGDTYEEIIVKASHQLLDGERDR